MLFYNRFKPRTLLKYAEIIMLLRFERTGNGSSPDEFCSSDEVKVFKDEGEDESEQNASECLQAELLEEEKSSLIKESEQACLVLVYQYRTLLYD
jgi:hypothetical protein